MGVIITPSDSRVVLCRIKYGGSRFAVEAYVYLVKQPLPDALGRLSDDLFKVVSLSESTNRYQCPQSLDHGNGINSF